MKKIVVISAEPSDARVLGDICRVYFPGSVPQYLPLSSAMQEVNEEYIKEKTLRLYIEEKIQPCSFQVKLEIEGQCYYGQSYDTGCYLGENEHNRRRRLIRLGVHQALVPYLQKQGRLISPWGIMNGVRPTKVVHRLLQHDLAPQSIISILQTEYGAQLNKAQLVTRVAMRQQPILAELNQEKTVSIYLAIPFCPTRCHYCSFPAFAMDRWGYLLESYLDCLEEEIKVMGQELNSLGYRVQTVYIGGGTPTVLSADQLSRLLGMIHNNYQLVPGAEITVEAGRPDTLDRPKLEALKAQGVSRISINPQTLHDKTLQLIGRRHKVEDILKSYTLAREIGFQVINMDLIIGLPGENMQLLAQTLEQILVLKPENITLHALALKRAASFKQEGVNGLPDNFEGAAMTALAQQTLEEAGYEAYYLYRQREIVGHGENVGYSMPGQSSKYNILMMEEAQTILGLGVGSSSKFIDNNTGSLENFYNPKDVLLYQERLPQLIQQKVDKVRSFG